VGFANNGNLPVGFGLVDEAASQSIELAELRNTLNNERSTSQEKLALLLDAKVALADQFKSLANDILEEKSKHFIEQNPTNLGALLNPLKLKIATRSLPHCMV
jgi:DNA recombination protein RmuC